MDKISAQQALLIVEMSNGNITFSEAVTFDKDQATTVVRFYTQLFPVAHTLHERFITLYPKETIV